MDSLERQRSSTQGFPKYDNYSFVKKEGSKEEKRPWDYIEILSFLAPEGAVLLDGGCGNAFKLEELISQSQNINVFAYDLNETLTLEAKQRSHAKDLPIDVFRADTLSPFPIKAESVDIVSFMLAKYNAQETFKVLKPGGLVVLERVGEKDKREAKILFGNDKNGKPRGFLSEFEPGELSSAYIKDFTSAGFEIVISKEGSWLTYYTKSGLIRLLESTPFVRDFEINKDKEVVDKIVKKFSTPKGIALTQHRNLLIAKKPL